MLKLRDQGHLLLEDVDSFTSANDTTLDEEQDTIEEFFHPDLQIPKVCYSKGPNGSISLIFLFQLFLISLFGTDKRWKKQK